MLDAEREDTLLVGLQSINQSLTTIAAPADWSLALGIELTFPKSALEFKVPRPYSPTWAMSGRR